MNVFWIGIAPLVNCGEHAERGLHRFHAFQHEMPFYTNKSEIRRKDLSIAYLSRQDSGPASTSLGHINKPNDLHPISHVS